MTKRFFLAAAVYLVIMPAYAQVTIDVSKISCKQFLLFSVADPRDIAIWLSGYYHGKRSNTMLQTQDLKANYDKLKDACRLSYGTPVMQVIEKMISNEK